MGCGVFLIKFDHLEEQKSKIKHFHRVCGGQQAVCAGCRHMCVQLSKIGLLFISLHSFGCFHNYEFEHLNVPVEMKIYHTRV